MKENSVDLVSINISKLTHPLYNYFSIKTIGEIDVSSLDNFFERAFFLP